MIVEIVGSVFLHPSKQPPQSGHDPKHGSQSPNHIRQEYPVKIRCRQWRSESTPANPHGPQPHTQGEKVKGGQEPPKDHGLRSI
jgi:hypothetical protein